MLAPNPTVTLLRQAKLKIADPKNWCQGRLHSEDGNQHCAAGAIQICSNSTREMDLAFRKLDAAAREFTPFRTFIDLNNTTDHPTVMKMFDRAIEMAMVSEGENYDS